MNQELAYTTALQAMTYVLKQEKSRDWFLNETGLSPSDLVAAPENPEILAGVLDFLLAHEDILIDFCTDQRIDPTLPARIRPVFPGANMESF